MLFNAVHSVIYRLQAVWGVSLSYLPKQIIGPPGISRTVLSLRDLAEVFPEEAKDNAAASWKITWTSKWHVCSLLQLL
ncbi:hypothetical protein LAZ67_1000367 [Cordylochernes scorpioides]|uniref:Uncharacterized protein n=1 Tax=Cordylochernes scorpioides TaxID=51811 RepID=A0ABY6JZ82_9ARAC|nr:hypothetical protein LAZ67_1000367 [Cordylochernes scorpioides]